MWMRALFQGSEFCSYQRHFCHQSFASDTGGRISEPGAGTPRPPLQPLARTADESREMDALSDLLSADAFAALLAREELRRSRTGEELAVAVLDVDGLGETSTRHGAQAAALVLEACADSLRRSVRAPDELAHTGEDEFSVLLHATDAKSAAAWEERFERMLEESTGNLAAGPVTCAVGIADSGEAPTLMEAAARARRRMEVVQTVRKLRRARGRGT
jgi:diguanylate cyclase (GGDEF)-like protein